METYMNIHETYTGPGSVAMLNVISAIAVLTVATSSSTCTNWAINAVRNVVTSCRFNIFPSATLDTIARIVVHRRADVSADDTVDTVADAVGTRGGRVSPNTTGNAVCHIITP